MSEASTPATCPHGHADTAKLLSTVALGAGTGGRVPAPGGGGGCCGGGCGCGG